MWTPTKVRRTRLYAAVYTNGSIITHTVRTEAKEAAKAYEQLMRDHIKGLPSYEWQCLRETRGVRLISFDVEAVLVNGKAL